MLARLFDIRPGEGKTVAPALAFAFLCIGAQTLAFIGSDTLFVSTFAVGELSKFYVVSSVLRVVVSLGYGAMASRTRGTSLDVAVLVGSAATLLGSAAASRAGAPAAVYATSLALLLVPSLLPLLATSAAMDCFHARQAKRLLPLIAAAATVGAIVFGGAAKALAPRLGVGSLLTLGAAVSLAAVPFPAWLARVAPAEAAAPEGEPKPGLFAMLGASLRDLAKVPVVRVFALTSLIGAATTNFVDFAFKAELKAAYDRDAMAGFLGSFNVASEAVILVIQLFLTGRIVGWLGVRSVLATRPLLVMVTGPLLVLLPGLLVTTGAKLGETVLRLSVIGAVSDLLLAPTSGPVRTRTKVLAKAASGPLGSLVAGAVLGMFGAAGPRPLALGIVLAVAGGLGVLVVLQAGHAYTDALAKSLGSGRASLDVSPVSAALLRSELTRVLREAAASGDVQRGRDVLHMMGDRWFAVEDVAPALTSPALRRDAVLVATHLASPGDAARLLALVPPSDDDVVERELLACARRLGDPVPEERVTRAVERGGASDDEAAAGLWGEALVLATKTALDPSLRKLRKAAQGPDGPRRAAALRAIAEIGDRRAEPQVLGALGSVDPAVFAEAARTAVRLGASGAVATLVHRLRTGPNVRAAARALAQAGPDAIGELVAALPTTPGEGGLRTAIASAPTITGTVRAARVLSRLGPEACTRVLGRYGDLGYRARDAVARSFASVPASTARKVDPAVVTGAIEHTVAYAEALARAWPHAGPGLAGAEIGHRVGETAGRVLDLASVVGDRAMVARARAALGAKERERSNALELLENVLPRAIAGRTVRLLELSHSGPGAPTESAPAFEGWLDKCRMLDRGALSSKDPMLAPMQRLLVLRESTLFTALSGEELYPVAEIAENVSADAGQPIVRQGDPGDALFVVATGKLRVIKDGHVLRELGRGEAFGEMALLDGSPRAATVEAIEASEVLRIPRAEFEALLDESPEIARGVIRTLLGHLRR